ncbi:MAG: hypothetical protein ACLU33_05705 [Christensenellales bacterium]
MKKIAQIILICLVLAGIIVIATLGFNVGVRYGENTQININIGKEFDSKDIKNIAKEVFGNQSVIVEYVEIYKDVVQITVKDATDEQIAELNNKINEKYELSNDLSNADDVLVARNANTRLRDLVMPYILPISISAAIIVIYEVIRFRKLGVWKVLYEAILAIIAPQAVLFSIYAIARIPVNRLTAAISIALYMLSVFKGIEIFLEQKQEKNA